MGVGSMVEVGVRGMDVDVGNAVAVAGVSVGGGRVASGVGVSENGGGAVANAMIPKQ